MLTAKVFQQVADLFVLLATCEREIEIARQILIEQPEFDPEQLFARIAAHGKSVISAREITHLFETYLLPFQSQDIISLFAVHGNAKSEITYTSFLKLILPNSSHLLRSLKIEFIPHRRKPAVISQSEEWALIRVLEMHMAHFRRIEAKKEEIYSSVPSNFPSLLFPCLSPTQSTAEHTDIAKFIACYENTPSSEDILHVLRRCDFDKDGRVGELDLELTLTPLRAMSKANKKKMINLNNAADENVENNSHILSLSMVSTSASKNKGRSDKKSHQQSSFSATKTTSASKNRSATKKFQDSIFMSPFLEKFIDRTPEKTASALQEHENIIYQQQQQLQQQEQQFYNNNNRNNYHNLSVGKLEEYNFQPKQEQTNTEYQPHIQPLNQDAFWSLRNQPENQQQQQNSSRSKHSVHSAHSIQSKHSQQSAAHSEQSAHTQQSKHSQQPSVRSHISQVSHHSQQQQKPQSTQKLSQRYIEASNLVNNDISNHPVDQEPLRRQQEEFKAAIKQQIIDEIQSETQQQHKQQQPHQQSVHQKSAASSKRNSLNAGTLPQQQQLPPQPLHGSYNVRRSSTSTTGGQQPQPSSQSNILIVDGGIEDSTKEQEQQELLLQQQKQQQQLPNSSRSSQHSAQQQLRRRSSQLSQNGRNIFDQQVQVAESSEIPANLPGLAQQISFSALPQSNSNTDQQQQQQPQFDQHASSFHYPGGHPLSQSEHKASFFSPKNSHSSHIPHPSYFSASAAKYLSYSPNRLDTSAFPNHFDYFTYSDSMHRTSSLVSELLREQHLQHRLREKHQLEQLVLERQLHEQLIRDQSSLQFLRDQQLHQQLRDQQLQEQIQREQELQAIREQQLKEHEALLQEEELRALLHEQDLRRIREEGEIRLIQEQQQELQRIREEEELRLLKDRESQIRREEEASRLLRFKEEQLRLMRQEEEYQQQLLQQQLSLIRTSGNLSEHISADIEAYKKQKLEEIEEHERKLEQGLREELDKYQSLAFESVKSRTLDATSTLSPMRYQPNKLSTATPLRLRTFETMTSASKITPLRARDFSASKSPAAIPFDEKSNAERLLVNMFVFMIESSQEVQAIKENLSMRADFSLQDIFAIMDANKDGAVDLKEFTSFLQTIKATKQQKQTSNNIPGVFKTLCADGQNVLVKEDIDRLFKPTLKDHADFLESKLSFFVSSQLNFNSYSDETAKLIVKIFAKLLVHDEDYCRIKKFLAIEGVANLFAQLDTDNAGYITQNTIKKFLTQHNMIFSDGELSNIFLVFNKERITLEDFQKEIAPKTSNNS